MTATTRTSGYSVVTYQQRSQEGQDVYELTLDLCDELVDVVLVVSFTIVGNGELSVRSGSLRHRSH